MRSRPIIGITADLKNDQYLVGRSYAEMISRAGGTPVILPCVIERLEELLELCDGIMLTGGADPIMTHWGRPMHLQATPIDPARQAFELALLEALDTKPQKPALGVCLGMQLMGLHAGGTLDQCLADCLPTADQHWDRRSHPIEGELGRGVVHSHHRQALSEPGSLRVVAAAPDGVIEAVRNDDRPFYLGVQWHPERTTDERLGLGLIRALVEHAAAVQERSVLTIE